MSRSGAVVPRVLGAPCFGNFEGMMRQILVVGARNFTSVSGENRIEEVSGARFI